MALRYQQLASRYVVFKDNENTRYKKLVDSSREAMILFNFGKPDFLNAQANKFLARLKVNCEHKRKMMENKKFYIFKRLDEDEVSSSESSDEKSSQKELGVYNLREVIDLVKKKGSNIIFTTSPKIAKSRNISEVNAILKKINMKRQNSMANPEYDPDGDFTFFTAKIFPIMQKVPSTSSLTSRSLDSTDQEYAVSLIDYSSHIIMENLNNEKK